MSAYQELPLTVTPLTLHHNYRAVRSVVELRETEPDAVRFDVAPVGRPQDATLSFVVAAGLIGIELCEPERLVLDTRPDIERRLPPIAIAVRHGAAVEPIRLLGNDWGARLRGPVWVRQSGTPTDLVVAVGAEQPAAFCLDSCELSWSVKGRPRSLRFSVSCMGTQLILRPSCRD